MVMGVDFGDLERFSRAVDALIEILGRDWLDLRLAALRPSSKGVRQHDGDRLLRALSEYPAMLEAMRHLQKPPDLDVYLFLGAVAQVASECGRSPGGEHFAKKLGELARSDQFSGFFDTLFEGEAALYWREQMHAESIEFPNASHPDFWATVRLREAPLMIANECKRISPSDPKELARETLSARVDEEVGRLWSTNGALKVIVWLHGPTTEIDEAGILDLLRCAVVDARKDPGAWFTVGAPTGAFQVSAALAPEQGQWAEREIRIEDVPAVGPLRVCIETHYLGKTQDPTRLKYVLSIRSDVLPNSIGAFERNLVDAVRQLSKSDVGVTGAVNVRIRPPRALGDLFEADAIVRRVLRESAADHVGLVILYWNETERQEGAWRAIDDHTERDVQASYSLQTHFIAGTHRPIDFRPIDSAKRRFPAHDGVVMRDPETGSLAPVGKDLLAFVEGQREEINDNAATIYVALKEPFPRNVRRQVLRAIKAGSRVFVPMFDDTRHMRVVEFEGWEPVRVATLDMRAWEGERELLFHVLWTVNGWTVGASCPRARGEVLAAAVPLRQAFV